MYGTADFTEFNAFVVTEDNSIVIVFSDGLIKFTQQLIDLVCTNLCCINELRITNEFEEIFTRHFIDIMISYHLLEDSYSALPLAFSGIRDYNDLDDPKKIENVMFSIEFCDRQKFNDMRDEFMDSTYLWMAAHEYSHLALGHLDIPNTTQREVKGQNIREVNFEWQQEYDADLLGAILSMQSESSFYQLYGINMAITCLFLSDYENIQGTLSHPPAMERKIRLMKYLTETKDITNDMGKRFEWIDKVIFCKFNEYKKFHSFIEMEKITFSSVTDLKNYIYNDYKINLD